MKLEHGVGDGRASGRRVDWPALALLALLILAFFWRAVLLGEVVLPLDILPGLQPWAAESTSQQSGTVWNPLVGDAVTQQYPEAVASIRAWTHGPPLWDPSVLTGMPALATGRAWSSPLIVALGRLLPAGRALTIATILHLMIGAAGCLLLLNELGCGRVGALVGSITFTFNPYFVGWFSHHSVVAGWVWIPLVFLGFEAALRRVDWRWVLVGGGAFALQVLSGYFLWSFFTGVTLALYAFALAAVDLLGRRGLRRAAAPLLVGSGIGAVGLGISAPLWLLTAELFPLTERVSDLFAGVFMPVAEMGRLLVPHLWGLPLHGRAHGGFFNFIETDLSVGAASLLLAVAALAARGNRRPLILAGIGLVAYLAVFGAPLAAELVGLVNPTFFKTFPGRVFFVTAFGLAVAAGIGADCLVRIRPAVAMRRLAVAAVASAGSLLTMAAVIQIRGVPGFLAFTRLGSDLLDPRTAPGRGVLLAAGVLLATGLVLWAGRSSRSRRRLGGSLVVVVVVELFALGIGFNPSFPPAMVFPTTPSLSVLGDLIESEAQPVRVIGVPTGEIVPGQMPMIWGLQTPTGYSSWLLGRYAAYTRLIPGETGGEIEAYFADCDHPLLDALNTGLVYAPADYALQGAGSIRLDQRLGVAQIGSHFAGGVAALRWQVAGVERPVILASGPTTISFRIVVPPSARLVTAVGLDPNAWEHSDGMVFLVRAITENSGEDAVRFKLRLDPRARPADRRFVPVEIDLSDLAGTVARVTLVTGPGPAGDHTCDWGGWVEPVVVSGGAPTLDLVHDGPNRIYRNRRALPRAWLVREVREVDPENLELVGRILASPSFNPAVEAAVEGRIDADLGSAGPADVVRIVDYRAERVELEVMTEEPALMVMSDMFYPGWRATIDGVERPILATNLIMRGVVVDGGAHRVVFEYRPAGMAIGLVVAGLVLLAGLAAFVLSVLGVAFVVGPADASSAAADSS